MLYVKKNEIESIQNITSIIIRNQTNLILVLGMFCCTLTTAIVIVICYNVAISISKPLKNVIRVADFINGNAGNKEAISNIIADYPNLALTLNAPQPLQNIFSTTIISKYDARLYSHHVNGTTKP